jgi:catechol 2,3-dioxygenase-like lactoylglutathione lyase family enzyme
MIKSISKISIVVREVIPVLKQYLDFGFKGDWTIRSSNSELKAILKYKKVLIELIEPLNNKSVFYRHLKKCGEGLHHLTFETDSLEDTLLSLERDSGISKYSLTNLEEEFDCLYVDSGKKLKSSFEICNKDLVSLNTFKTIKHGVLDKGAIRFEVNSGDSMYGPVVQIGYLTRDVKDTVRKYSEVFGLGPWVFYKITPYRVKDMTVNGKRKDHSFIFGATSIGDIELEFIQPLDESIYTEYLDEYGEGLHHICILTEDYKNTLNFLKNKGLEIIQGGVWNGCEYCYLSSSNELKFLIELYNCPPGWKRPKPDFTYP